MPPDFAVIFKNWYQMSPAPNVAVPLFARSYSAPPRYLPDCSQGGGVAARGGAWRNHQPPLTKGRLHRAQRGCRFSTRCSFPPSSPSVPPSGPVPPTRCCQPPAVNGPWRLLGTLEWCIPRELHMTPRKPALDLQIPRHNLAHFCCVKCRHPTFSPFLISPSPGSR